MKAATKWLQRLKRTGIEKGTASISELKSLIPEAAAIRVDLSDDVRVLKQATCSYCICSRPGEDLGFLVECQTCTEGYHGVCMGISQEQADVMRKSEEGFKCLRCRINNLFTSAEQAMLGAMKKWMPSTCFAEQAGFDKTPSTDDSGTIEHYYLTFSQFVDAYYARLSRYHSVANVHMRSCQVFQVGIDGNPHRTSLRWLAWCEMP